MGGRRSVSQTSDSGESDSQVLVGRLAALVKSARLNTAADADKENSVDFAAQENRQCPRIPQQTGDGVQLLCHGIT